MKVLMVNCVCGIGSTGRICVDIAEVLQSEGHQSKIAYGREKGISVENSIRIGNKYSPYINALKCRVLDNEGFAAKRATKKLIKQIQEYNPDIIHLHNLHGYYLNVEILFEYLKQCDKPIFWTLHDCWAFTGHCPYFSAIGCEQWKTVCVKCAQTKMYPHCYLFDRAKRNFQRKKEAFTDVPNMTIITPSNWLAGLVKESFLREYPVCVIPNGIDTTKFSRIESDFKSRYGLENKKMILGVAQVWDARKGLKDFIKISENLEEEYQVVLVGLTEKQKKSLPDKIIGFTRTNSLEELAEMYSAAEVFVNVTYEDNFPTVNIEALACGTPIITYQTGGSPEVADEENQIVCPQGDILAVKESIVSLENKNQALKNKLRLMENAKKYSRQEMTKKYIEIYKKSL